MVWNWFSQRGRLQRGFQREGHRLNSRCSWVVIHSLSKTKGACLVWNVIVIYRVTKIPAAHISVSGVYGGQDSFISAEINIKLWSNSINPLARPSNSSLEEAAVQEVKYRRVEEMHEQNLTDGWGSYYPTGRTCHLLPVARLPLPLVSFYDGDYGADAWTSSAPKVPYQS